MTTEREAHLEIRTAGGELLFVISVRGINLELSQNSNPPTKRTEEHRPTEVKTNNHGSEAHGEPMSDAQKRYLYRLMAEEGFEGDQATEKLKQILNVKVIKDAKKSQASKAIERLLEGKGAKKNGSPV